MTPSKNAPGCLSAEETALFCSQAAMVLKSGIPLADGLTALCEDFRDTRSGAQLARLSQAISQTGSLAQALDIALARRALPAILASAPLEALRALPEMVADMEECQKLLESPLPIF